MTSYFHIGLAAAARKNPLTAKGFPTCVPLNPKIPFIVNYVMAVAKIPKGFDQVVSITAGKDKKAVTLKAKSGKSVTVPLDVDFSRGPVAGHETQRSSGDSDAAREARCD